MKKLLIVVDYQKDFVTGSLGNPHAAAIEERICEKIRRFRSAGDDIAFTFDTHHPDYLQTQEGRLLPVTHCMEHENGWRLTDAVDALRQSQDRCFCKECFGSAALFDFLRGVSYESIELVGVVTNICVISNAVLAKTASPETPVTVDAACCAGNDPMLHEKALDVMQSLQIQVINR